MPASVPAATEPHEAASRSGQLLAGLLAALLALALLWAFSRVERSLRFPPLALAELAIRLTPGDVATYFIENLGHWAIRTLAIGATLFFAALGATLPLRVAAKGRSQVNVASALFALTLFVASLGANLRPSTSSALAMAAIGGLSYGATLSWLLGTMPRILHMETDLDRRRAFGTAAGAAVAFALGGTLLGRLIGGGGPGEVALGSQIRRARIPVRSAFPKITGLSPEVTSPADHYVVDINLEKPVVDVSSWTLRVDGLVDRPLELSFDELQERFEVVEEYSVLTCVSNQVGGPLIGNSKWTGVRLREVLAAAGLQPEAKDLLLTAADGYTVTIRPEVATSPIAMLAIAQNGKPLTVEHGFPCRLRIPQLYGMMNAKWLQRIEAIDSDEEGFWAQRGWSDVAVVRTQSRIDTADPPPAAGAETWLAGVAWAGDRGISRVEVSSDGGQSWNPARLHEPISPVAWTQWAFRWAPAKSGIARLAVRATDGTGTTQTAGLAAPHPSGATGYHQVDVEVS